MLFSVQFFFFNYFTEITDIHVTEEMLYTLQYKEETTLQFNKENFGEYETHQKK